MPEAWFRERAALSLYTSWRDASAGDVVIGTAALAITLLATRAGPLESWRWTRIARAPRSLAPVTRSPANG
ncbi:MAG TPA: hypothetical protein VE085_11195 [Burkholderiales bacterium]|nr:hypothetical protein [Burkholderiales bacterium]